MDWHNVSRRWYTEVKYKTRSVFFMMMSKKEYDVHRKIILEGVHRPAKENEPKGIFTKLLKLLNLQKKIQYE